MLVIGDLGFQSLCLVVCLFSPVIGLVIRHKWQLAEARKEEVKRLLVLASEEAARVEFEASYGYAALPTSRNYYCAICYSPTTTRCAGCKAVRYCSGRCQIIHWRRGHKEECCTLTTNDLALERERDHQHTATKEQLWKTYVGKSEIDRRQNIKPTETPPFEEHAKFNFDCSPGAISEEEDGSIKDEFLADSDDRKTNASCESSVTSFSGFSSSTSSDELSNVSDSEDGIKTETETSHGHMLADIGFDIPEVTPGINIMYESKSLSPKFASLVDSVDSFTKLCKVDQLKPADSNLEGPSASISSSGFSSSRKCKAPSTESCTVSSGFEGKTFNSFDSKNNSQRDSAESSFDMANKSKSSKSKSSLQFSFDLSAIASPPLHPQGSEADEIKAQNDLSASSRINKPTDRVAFSENNSVDSSKAGCSLSYREGPKHVESATNYRLNSQTVKSMLSSSSYIPPSLNLKRELKSNHDANTSIFSSSMSERSNQVVSNPDNTHILKSRSISCSSSSSSAFDASISSSIGGRIVSDMGPGKVDNKPARASVSSHVATSSPNTINGLKTSVLKVVDQFRVSKSKHNSLDVLSETSGGPVEKGLFPYESFVKLYNWNKVELRPSGFINCGNSCYANVVLQCLAFTPPLTAYFLQGLHSKACIKDKWCFTCEFESLILKAKEGKSPLSPIGIISQLRNIGSQLNNGREEDAHEFLRYAIDTMQSSNLMEAGVSASGSLKEETTLVGLTFGGYLLSKIKCTRCRGRTERQERIMDLTVEIEGDIGSLEEALQQFTSTEVLDGDNKYKCSRCKSYVRAKKKFTILDPPNVLTIALKRFQSGRFGKLNKPILFPETLDLAPFVSGTSGKSHIYKLFGVIVHLDIMNASFSGHYVCYVKNFRNKWFKIDDSTVTVVDRERVFTKGAYMLLYSRSSPRTPRLLRHKILTPDLKSKVISSWINARNAPYKATVPVNPISQFSHSTNTSDGFACFDSFLRFHQLQRLLEEDSSSSDSSSLFSSNSDEGSYSTDSTRDSVSLEDFSDYIFGDSDRYASDFPESRSDCPRI